MHQDAAHRSCLVAAMFILAVIGLVGDADRLRVVALKRKGRRIVQDQD